MDDLEHVLMQYSPGEPDARLRKRVLMDVDRELSKSMRTRWVRRPGVAIAASLLFAVAVNAWVYELDCKRQAAFFMSGPPRTVIEIADAVESVTDRETAQLVQKRLETVWRNRSPQPRNDSQQEVMRLLRELQPLSISTKSCPASSVG
jgi:hypothetical protein